jgi:quinoprotein glucose dehydrogenase
MLSKTMKHPGRRTSPQTVCLSAVFLCAASFAHAATLPDGPGKAETIRVCGKCHLVDQAVSLRQGQQGWKETISKMVDLGAEGSNAEFAAIFNYLVRNFSGGNSNPSSPGLTPGTTLPRLTQSPDKARVPDGARNSGPPLRRDRPDNFESFKPGPPIPAAKEWPTYGHDPGGQRFSPLSQVTPETSGG